MLAPRVGECLRACKTVFGGSGQGETTILAKSLVEKDAAWDNL
jgi:hypothetical protein